MPSTRQENDVQTTEFFVPPHAVQQSVEPMLTMRQTIYYSFAIHSWEFSGSHGTCWLFYGFQVLSFPSSILRKNIAVYECLIGTRKVSGICRHIHILNDIHWKLNAMINTILLVVVSYIIQRPLAIEQSWINFCCCLFFPTKRTDLMVKVQVGEWNMEHGTWIRCLSVGIH